jgi:hypothetical protein
MTDTFIAIADHDFGMKCNHKACRITFVDAGLTVSGGSDPLIYDIPDA